MKYIATILLFILTTAAFGQMDTSIIKITRKQYHEYVFKERQCPTDNDTGVADSAFSDVKEISYPEIKTGNQTLNKFINDTIRKITTVNELKKTSKIAWKYDCIEDKPQELYGDYKINFINSRYLSLTITSDTYAGGGGNGAGHSQTALTFDLQKRKIMLLRDVVKKHVDSAVYDIIIAEMKALSAGLFGQFGEINNPTLFHFTSALDQPIAIKKDRVIIYWNVSWGSRSSCEDINIYFAQHGNLFDKKFIEPVRNK